MEFRIHNTQNGLIAELVKGSSVIRDLDDAVDILGNANYNGAGSIIIFEDQLPGDFFNLSSGVAGEILQKFSNYSMRLAIVGDFSKFTSKSLKDFIYESNRVRKICFVSSIEEALASLS